MKKTLMLFCAVIFSLNMNVYAEYADPLENPWVFTLEEHWPGVDPVEGNGMTAKLKVPINDTDRTNFDLWQLDIPKGTSTNLVMHPTTFDTSDYTFAKAGPTIYKTAVVVKGDIEVTFSNCKTAYTAETRDTIHLVPDTPHKFKAMKEDAIVMIYCYGEGASEDKDKNFVKAYFDETAVDEFTVLPKDEDIRCDQNVKDELYIGPFDFIGPNNEIRRSVRHSIVSNIDPNFFLKNHLKVATFETDNQIDFLEYEWFDFDYYPHDHKDFQETMLITHKEVTFWVGAGTGNGLIDTSNPKFRIKIDDTEARDQTTDRKMHPADETRIGDGVRVKPGYVVYMPAGVPHSMSETEDGNIWYMTSYPAGTLSSGLGARGGRVYKPDAKPPT